MKMNKLILFILLFITCSLVYAQNDGIKPPGYFIDYSEVQPRFMQRFVWKAEEYAMRYEIFIQVDDHGYRDYLLEVTADHFIEVSLPPGKYRYSVTPFDVLGRPRDSSNSEWKEITVIEALQPHVAGFSPDAFFLDQSFDRILTLSGSNIFGESEIFLENTDILYPIEMRPVLIDINNDKVTLHFDDLTLIPGQYNIYVKNPGGLDTRAGPFNVAYRKPFYIFTKLFFTPIIPVHGQLYNVFGARVFPGAGFSLELISSKRSTFNGGFELAGAMFLIDSVWTFLDGIQKRETKVTLGTINLNIALQKSFNQGKTAFTFRFGYGMTSIGSYGDFDTPQYAGNLNLSATFLFRLYKMLYWETGVDYSHIMTTPSSDVLKPKVGIMLRF
jgi:hypothetical protein